MNPLLSVTESYRKKHRRDPLKDSFIGDLGFHGGNAMKGLAAGALGAPVDLMTMFLRPLGYRAEPYGGSEQIGKALGADTDRASFIAGLFGAPDTTDIGRVGAVLGERAPEILAGITAFHGSPYKFDRFDMSKIGTGEGAQAFGHGIYLAENPKTGEFYSKVAERSPDVRGGSHLYKVDIPDSAIDKMLDWGKPLREQPRSVQDAVFRALEIDRTDDALSAQGWDAYETLSNYMGPEDASRLLKENGIPGIKYLDEGSRIEDQSGYRFTLMIKNGGKQESPIFKTKDMAKQEAKKAKAFGNVENVTEPEYVTEKAPPRTRNFVVFDEDLISIKARNEVLTKIEKANRPSVEFKPSRYGGETVMVDVEKLDKSFRKDPLYTTDKIDLDLTKPVEVPHIELGPNGVGFTDGRHRFQALKEMGFKKIPVTVPKDQVQAVKKALQ